MDRTYGIIVERKTEKPLLMECYPMTHEAAREKMREFSRDPEVIRVAIVALTYVNGHEGLACGEFPF